MGGAGYNTPLKDGAESDRILILLGYLLVGKNSPLAVTILLIFCF
jgi:hypothetical protein